MRVGITILPEFRWSEAAPKWQAAEELGFDHAWTYDHLVWAGLPDSPWFGTVPTLTAAAMVTDRIRLGTFVASPNYRHPAAFARDVLALDDISDGRFVCGLGKGGDIDAGLLGEQLSVRQRSDRFREFVRLLDRILREDHVTTDGEFYATRDVRNLPGCVQRPRVPFIIAANGPKALRLAAEVGQGWVTLGEHTETEQQWWDSLARLNNRMDAALEAAGRPTTEFERHLNLDAFRGSAYESVDRFADLAGRAGELGFTDVITHWPRTESPYAASMQVLESVAVEVLPKLRAG